MQIKVFPKIVKIRGLNNKDILLAYLCKKDNEKDNSTNKDRKKV